MPLSAKAQFMKRAREALEQGNASFVARGKNKELFEEMKRKFEQEKNAQSEPDSKRMKLSAAAPAAVPAGQAESNSSDSSSNSSSDSENDPPQSKSSSSHEDVVKEQEMQIGGGRVWLGYCQSMLVCDNMLYMILRLTDCGSSYLAILYCVSHCSPCL
jgi:ABC-type uncharacterized transport system involved in gliding motility auxiliary subunit